MDRQATTMEIITRLPRSLQGLEPFTKRILWKDWLPYVRVKITGLCLNLLISLLFIQKDERKKDPGHLEGWREGELLCACPADSLPDQPILSHRCTANFAAQPEDPRGFPSAPKAAAACGGRDLHGGILFSGNLSWCHRFAGSSRGTASPCVVHPIQPFPLPLQRSFGLQVSVFPSSWNNTDVVRELMSAKSWTQNWREARCIRMLLVL